MCSPFTREVDHVTAITGASHTHVTKPRVTYTCYQATRHIHMLPGHASHTHVTKPCDAYTVDKEKQDVRRDVNPHYPDGNIQPEGIRNVTEGCISHPGVMNCCLCVSKTHYG